MKASNNETLKDLKYKFYLKAKEFKIRNRL